MMTVQAGFRTTLDLFQAGVDLMRQNLRRRDPTPAEAEIDRRLRLQSSICFASSGIEQEIVADAEAIEPLPRFIMNAARVGRLIALKVPSRDDERRPQDLVDLRALRSAASAEELARAHGSPALISSRGYHRGRDLAGGMRRLVGNP
jgi:hypothetical protein